jgi:hypothetical protein
VEPVNAFAHSTVGCSGCVVGYSGCVEPVHAARSLLCCVYAIGAPVQIHPGHAVLEGRKPALLDSLVQVGG